MGSGSDWDTMKFTSKTLGELGVPHETRVVSAHRTPDLLSNTLPTRKNAASKSSSPVQAAPRIFPA